MKLCQRYDILTYDAVVGVMSLLFFLNLIDAFVIIAVAVVAAAVLVATVAAVVVIFVLNFDS